MRRTPTSVECTAWGVLWRSKNRLDGERTHLYGNAYHPSRTLLFETREKAREWIATEFGYLKERADLKREPHGWQMPRAVKVKITVESTS